MVFGIYQHQLATGIPNEWKLSIWESSTEKNQRGILYSLLGTDAPKLAGFAEEDRKAFTGEVTYVVTKAGLGSFPWSQPIQEMGVLFIIFLTIRSFYQGEAERRDESSGEEKGQRKRGTKALQGYRIAINPFFAAAS